MRIHINKKFLVIISILIRISFQFGVKNEPFGEKIYSNFELIDMKTGNALLEGQDLQFRQIVHTR